VHSSSTFSKGDCRPLTAIQLRPDGDVAARLLYGEPASIVAGELGDIALLPPGAIAAYLVKTDSATAFYLFRTSFGGAGELAEVPGVRGPVRVFIATSRRGYATRTRYFLRRLTRYGYVPSDLSDDFWTRATGALAARGRVSPQLLPYLLQRETQG
jgi:hypothetical protein